MSPKRPRNPFRSDLPRAYWLLWVGTLINRLGGFVIPFLTLYLTDQRGVSVSQAALMVSLFGAGSFSASLAGGEIADRIGRRPVLLISFLAAPVNMLALGLSRPLPLIAMLCFSQGFLTDLYRPAVGAAIADLVPPEARTRAYGYIYWAINVGAAVAPAVAGQMAHLNYLLLFAGDAVTTFIFGLIVLLGLRETRPLPDPAQAPARSSGRLAQMGREPILLLFSALTLVFAIIYVQGEVTLPVDIRAHGLGPDVYGLIIAANGALVVLLSLPLSRWAARRRPFRLLALAAVFLGSGFGLTGLSAAVPIYVLSVAIWTVGEILGASVAPTIIANLSPPDLRGLYQGVFGAAWGLAGFGGPVLGGWIYQRWGAPALWSGCFGLGLLLAAGYLGLAARTAATPSGGRRAAAPESAA